MSKNWHQLLTTDHEITERLLAAMEKVLASKAGPTGAAVAGMFDYARNYIDQCH